MGKAVFLTLVILTSVLSHAADKPFSRETFSEFFEGVRDLGRKGYFRTENDARMILEKINLVSQEADLSDNDWYWSDGGFLDRNLGVIAVTRSLALGGWHTQK